MSKLSKLCVEQKGRVLLAILAIKNYKFSSLRKIAKIFNISKSILRRHLKKASFKGDLRANSYKLITSKEKSLK